MSKSTEEQEHYSSISVFSIPWGLHLNRPQSDHARWVHHLNLSDLVAMAYGCTQEEPLVLWFDLWPPLYTFINGVNFAIRAPLPSEALVQQYTVLYYTNTCWNTILVILQSVHTTVALVSTWNLKEYSMFSRLNLSMTCSVCN